jgi:hypothetical protein
MKIFLTASLILFPFFCFSQASRSSDFQLEVKFGKEVAVQHIEPFYYKRSNNHFNDINYTVDTINNSISLYGNNNRVVGVPFPTLFFSYRSKDSSNFYRNDHEPFERIQCFYIITGFGIESYNQRNVQALFFRKDDMAILTEMENGENLLITKTSVSTGLTEQFKSNMEIGYEIIKINKQKIFQNSGEKPVRKAY